jgi:SAM-dependent methyltransferase/catechol 2,3-dioxygenase-like lactoylglutathione lyase family enzyme
MRDDGYFDEPVAARYDESEADMFGSEALDPIVDFLADVAGYGRALELGIGTGRIALPLSRRGVRVHGIDMSEAMVARLRAKPGGDHIGVTIGDFATTAVDGSFSLAYLVFNTIMNLTTQAGQVACFSNVAAHLQPGGCFVIEVMVPDLQRLPRGDTIRAFHVGEADWGFDEYDVARQGLISHHFTMVDGAVERFSVPFRYVWPSELDLMAQMAGMRLRERWSDWKREPFTSDSLQHVSVWEKPAGQGAPDGRRILRQGTDPVWPRTVDRGRSSMIGATMVVATIPVTDLDRTRTFYRDTLGLTLLWENPVSIRFRCGEGSELSTFRRPATATEHTLAHFEVADIDATVTDLEAKGVAFLDYTEGPLVTTGHIAQLGPARGAWFRDPDGNTLGLRQG